MHALPIGADRPRIRYRQNYITSPQSRTEGPSSCLETEHLSLPGKQAHHVIQTSLIRFHEINSRSKLQKSRVEERFPVKAARNVQLWQFLLTERIQDRIKTNIIIDQEVRRFLDACSNGASVTPRTFCLA